MACSNASSTEWVGMREEEETFFSLKTVALGRQKVVSIVFADAAFSQTTQRNAQYLQVFVYILYQVYLYYNRCTYVELVWDMFCSGSRAITAMQSI